MYEFADTKAKKAELISNYISKVFGEAAKNYLEFYEYDWLYEKYQYGCFVTRPKIGAWTTLGKEVWGKPIDDSIYFIGTENSPEFNRYIEGALRSAINFAKTIK